MVEGATRAIGLQTAAKELGVDVTDMQVEMRTDSSAAKSFASSGGSGRVKHIETKWLWLQSAVAEGRFSMGKVSGVLNPADVLTKYVAVDDAARKLGFVNIEVVKKLKRDMGADGVDAAADRDSHSRIARKARGVWSSGERLVWADAEDTDEEREAVEGFAACCLADGSAGGSGGHARSRVSEEECRELACSAAILA